MAGLLTDTAIRNEKAPGLLSDGPRAFGLSLRVKVVKGGDLSKTWVQRLRVKGKYTQLGLGSYPVITLAQARQRAEDNARIAAEGGDPRIRDDVPTFRDMLEEVIDSRKTRWRNDRSEKQWRSSLETHASALLDRPVTDIAAADVLDVLKPIWSTKPETARRVRSRIAIVMGWVITHNHRLDNPAGEIIFQALDRRKPPPEHFRSLDYRAVGAALEAVRASKATPSVKLALEFQTLTACRSGEVRGCRWAEIDPNEEIWTIPAERTKTEQEHVVPLSDQAMELLGQALARSDDSGLVFPSPEGTMLSDSTLSKLMRDLKLDGTPHGMRASFRSWCSDKGHSPDLAEKALGHALQGVQRAYNRADMLDRRKLLMQAWADYLDTGQTSQPIT